jgi:hypothetical protein
LFHELCKVIVDVLEACELVAQHRLDIGWPKKDAFKINVTSLNVNPIVESDTDLLESLRPWFDVLLKNLIVRRHLHRVDVIHVVLA